MNEYISLLSMYLYDNSLFDNIELPKELNKETFINNLLLECSELEVVYTDYNFLKSALTFWSKSRIHTWERMADVLYANYDPFISMERTEVRDISNTHSDTRKNTTQENSNGQADTYTNAWDTSEDTKRETLKNKADNTATGNEDTSGKYNTKETFNSKGDSALYTKQEILKQEMEARDKFNLYNYIINDFKKKFCLLVY